MKTLSPRSRKVVIWLADHERALANASAESEIEPMAGNLPVPQGAEVKLVWSLSGTPSALNILHFNHEVGAVMTQAKADAISTLVKAAVTSSGIGTRLWTNVALLRVETRHMDSNTDPWFIGAGAGVPGASADNPLPAATAFCVTLKTGLRGRSYNGRVYLWGWTEFANDTQGGADTSSKDGAVAFIDTIRSNMSSAQQLTMGVLTRWTTPPGSPPNTPPVERTPPVITPVTTVVALDQRWDVQRRRAIPGI
jgi:hypothetical protein